MTTSPSDPFPFPLTEDQPLPGMPEPDPCDHDGKGPHDPSPFLGCPEPRVVHLMADTGDEIRDLLPACDPEATSDAAGWVQVDPVRERVTCAACLEIPAPSTEVERSAAVLDLNAADELLDELALDSRRRETAAGMRETLIDVVRRRARRRQAKRPEKIKSATDVRPELVGAADDAATLDALAGAFTAAAKDAREVAGELIDEVPRARRSVKVADGQGFELTVSRDQRTELSVAQDDVVDVLVASLLETTDVVMTPAGDKAITSYAAGAREGIAAFRGLISTTPTYRSTALESLATQLEDAGEDDLAKRLRSAFGRVDRGEPTHKIERKPLPTPKGSDA